jgi:predicted Zn-dependent peptidase
MKIEETKIKNGAKIIGIKMSGSKSVLISFGFRTGSRSEPKEISGISHFLEHMMFKGSKKRPTAEAIARAADSIGGQYNAFTGKEYTVYYIKASKENFAEALDIIGDMVTRPLLLEEEINKERGTIIQEAKMYEDNPNISIFETIEESLFGDNPLGWNIVGFMKSIKGINQKSMRAYYKRHYNGSNARIVIAGDLPNDYQIKVKKYASLFKPGRKTEWNREKFNKKQLLVKYKDTEQAHIGFALPGVDIFNKDRHILQVAASILGGYMSARLFTEIREKRGWAYRVWAFSDELSDTGYLGVFGGVKKEKAAESLEIIKKEVLNLSETLTDEEVKRAVENIKGSSVLKYDNPEELGNYVMLRALLKDRIELPGEHIKRIARVKKLDVIRVIDSLFGPEGIHLTVIGPFKDKEKFAKILTQK